MFHRIFQTPFIYLASGLLLSLKIQESLLTQLAVSLYHPENIRKLCLKCCKLNMAMALFLRMHKDSKTKKYKVNEKGCSFQTSTNHDINEEKKKLWQTRHI